MKFCGETSSRAADSLLAAFFKAPVPFGCTLMLVCQAYRFHFYTDNIFLLKRFNKTSPSTILHRKPDLSENRIYRPIGKKGGEKISQAINRDWFI